MILRVISSLLFLLLPLISLSKTKSDYPVHIYFEKRNYKIFKDNTVSFTFIRKYKILNQQGIRSWNDVTASWYAWYQTKPIISATVVSPGGKITHLDPKTIGEMTSKQSDQLVYSDRKTIKGPLPAIEIGSIIEEKYVYRDKKPFFHGGIQKWFTVNRHVPIDKVILVIDKPQNTHLKYKLLNIKSTPEITKNGKREKFTFKFKDVKPYKGDKSYLHPSEYVWSSVIFSTVPGWKNVARKYNALVEKQLEKSKNLKQIIEALPSKKLKGRKLIAALMKVIHKQIRYTGLEFGDASIIPRSPDEVLKRRYGDCKDKAALLVALLRHYHIKAHLVLLNSGFRSDIIKEIPGANYFNHAIVYIPGPYNVWVDATEKFVPLGEIPPRDQDRYALIIDSKTKGLVKTPKKNYNQNVEYLKREVFMSQLGAARIVESHKSTGKYAYRSRRYFHRMGRNKIKKMLERYVKGAFDSKEISKFSYTDPLKLTPDFKYSFVVDKTDYAYTNLDNGYATLKLGYIVNKLPSSLSNLKFYNKKGEAKKSPWLKRSKALQLPIPHRYVLKYKIHIPPGFKVVKLPKDRLIKIASGSIIENYSISKGIIYVYREFSSGAGYYKPSEISQLRKVLYNLNKRSRITLRLYSKGSEFLQKGQVKKAVELYKTFLAKYPKEPGNYIRLANVLLKAGFRDAAVTYIKKAIALDDKLVEAHMMLGLTYLHDPFGRQFKGSMNLAAAMKSYKKVTTLDVKNIKAWRLLAILTEYDKDGIRYSPDANLKEAVSLLARYRFQTGKNDLDVNYLTALFFTRKYDQVLNLKNFKKTKNIQSLRLASKAILYDVPAMMNMLNSITGESSERAKLLKETAQYCINARKYKIAASLLYQLSRFSSDSMKVQSRSFYLRDIKPYQMINTKRKGPEKVIYDFFKMLYINGVNEKGIKKIFTSQTISLNGLKDIQGNFKTYRKSLIKRANAEGYLYDNKLDIIFSKMSFRKKGNDSIGWQITLTIDLLNNPVKSYYYVKKENGLYKIINYSSTIPYSLGLHALDLLKKNNIKGASTVLNWVYDLNGNKNLKTFEGHPFHHVWKKDSVNRERIELAALTLLSNKKDYGKKIEKLRRKYYEKKMVAQIDRALLIHYYVMDKNYKAYVVLKRLQKVDPNSDAVNMTLLEVLGKLRKFREIDKLINNLLKKDPEKSKYLYTKAAYMAEEGRIKEARKYLEKLHNKNLGDARTYNLLAWIGLFDDTSLYEMLGLAMKSNRLSKFNTWAYLHTLATIYADMEKVSEAKQVVNHMLEKSNQKEIREVDNYILGRNAETLGLPDIAQYHYQKIKRAKNMKHLTVYELAQKRLKRLKKK